MDKYSGINVYNPLNTVTTTSSPNGTADGSTQVFPSTVSSYISVPPDMVNAKIEVALEEFIKDNLVFGPIVGCKIIGNKAIIKATELYYKSKVGNIYIPEVNLYGAYSEEDLLFGKNIILTEFERDLTDQEIKPGMHFTFVPQGDNGLSLDDVKNLFKDEGGYYQYIHMQLAKKGNNRTGEDKLHRDLDIKLNLNPKCFDI